VTTIYLARHGESDWNAENRFQGQTDRPLTERGRAQAEALASELLDTPLEAVYASPLRRALETAETVASPRGLRAAGLPELREIDVGTWTGLSRSEVASRFPDAFRRWIDGGEGWEDGETYDAMSGRVLAGIRRIADEHPEGNVLVVSHGGPIRAVHAAAEAMDVRAYRALRRVEPNARLSVVTVEGGEITRLRSFR
jgi:broad specificity phosphatase PhoE